MILSIDIVQSISIILVLIFFFLGFRLLESNWSYKISKPYLWETSIKEGAISSRLKNIERTYRDRVRFYTIWMQIERLKKEKVSGAFAELGVYKGETARIIHESDPERKLYLFDTFTGFDAKDLQQENGKDKKYSPDNFSDTNVNEVKTFIAGNENVIFIPGYFPGSAADITEAHYAFVHLDADLYAPTLAALQYFYPKLSRGGVILVHDYNHTWLGLRKAVDEFLSTIPESPFEIADWQGSIMIIKNRF